MDLGWLHFPAESQGVAGSGARLLVSSCRTPPSQCMVLARSQEMHMKHGEPHAMEAGCPGSVPCYHLQLLEVAGAMHCQGVCLLLLKLPLAVGAVRHGEGMWRGHSLPHSNPPSHPHALSTLPPTTTPCPPPPQTQPHTSRTPLTPTHPTTDPTTPHVLPHTCPTCNIQE